MNQEYKNPNSEPDLLNLGRYLRLILLQSKLILVITLAGFIMGIAFYTLSPKTFKISSLLQVYSPAQRFDPRQSLSLDFFNAPETNLDNLITLYSSRSNILDLINDLNLNLKIDNLEDKKFLDIKTFLFKSDEKYNQKIFYIQTQNNSFNLLDDKKNILMKGVNGEYIENNNFKIKLSFPNIGSKKLIEISYRDPSNLYTLYKNKLQISNLGTRQNFWSQEGLIEISFVSDDTIEGKSIVNLANKIFIRDNIKVETEKARKSMLFIDTQLEGLEENLSLRKSELQNFKQENKSINVTLEVQSIIDLTSEIEKKINLIDLEISQAEMNFTKDNPIYLNLKAQKEELVIQKSNIEQKISNLPIAQQEYVDLFRNLEISEQLYSELVNRRLNFSLMEASSIGNIRVVDDAFVANLVGPKLYTPFFLTIMAFLVGISSAIFRGTFFISISNPAELRDAGIKEKVIGVIPNIQEGNSEDDNKYLQSFETLILNLKNIMDSNNDFKKNCKKIVITSPTPENGKSYTSRCIAMRLAEIGHKVLLIDADLKRGSQHNFFNIDQIQYEEFKNISAENLEIKKNFYLLPKIKHLKNSFEYLYGPLFLNKIEEYENLFDYIIFDTAPALSVSDTGLLMTMADINLLVIRHQINKINEVKQTNQIIDQIGRSFNGIIYNDYSKPKGYYGYYDIYGDYSYRYYAERYLYEESYEEKND